MLTLGLTGGIGSGKTAVSDLFAAKGITIVDADVVSRIVVEPGKPALEKIAERYGDEVIAADGSLDRRALRNIVFADPDDKTELRWLEQLQHPLIAEEIMRQLNASESPYRILVSPILIESGQSQMVDRILVVDVPETTQIERTVKRDDTNENGVKSIIANQMSREDRCAKADDIILNDKDLAHLEAEVEKLHQFYLSLD